MSNDSIVKVVLVTVLVCLVCSVVVSTVAVELRPLQEYNKQIDRQSSILEVAGLYSPDMESVAMEQLFAQIETRVVNLESGKFLDVDPTKFVVDETSFISLSNKDDVANISRRPKNVKIYLLRKKGVVDKIILPIYGYGLWSILYGFIALEENGKEIFALKFYEHAETPGLGGEVDNPKWRRLWHGKFLHDETGVLRLKVIKGKVRPAAPDARYEVDGLSGATLTSRGVTNMLDFWFGGLGYQKFLQRVKAGEIS